jgi:hypothetical protein
VVNTPQSVSTLAQLSVLNNQTKHANSAETRSKYLLRAAKQHYPAMLEQLETLVSIETTSQDKPNVDQAARLLAEWLQALGERLE